MKISLSNTFTTNFKAEQRCRDGVMNEFVSSCKHLLVSLFSCHNIPTSPFIHRNDFFPLVTLRLYSKDLQQYLQLGLISK